MSDIVNRRIVLASRPHGRPTADNFRLEQVPVPPLQDGEMLLQTLFLSLDPYMRGRMSDAPSYAPPLAIGEVMVGGTVARVVESRHRGFPAGTLVRSYNGWQSHAVSHGGGVSVLPPGIDPPSLALGVIGMPGFTAYMGLLEIGRPGAGETVVVAAATGAVGSVVGQIARLRGCRVVGIAGGQDKCEWAVRELGFDACIDHRGGNLPGALQAACPQGIDVYFENVGGAVFAAVLPLLNPGARVPVCGVISQYNAAPSSAAAAAAAPLDLILRRRITVRGFIINLDFGDRFPEFEAQMTAWLAEGRIKHREHVIDGLEGAPAGLIALLDGGNFGKAVVRVAG